MVFQARQPRQRFGGIAAILRARHRHLPFREPRDQVTQLVGCQILVVVLADLGHRRVGAGPETFHLFPAELAIGRQGMGLFADQFLADRDQILGPADHAGRGAAYLDVCN